MIERINFLAKKQKTEELTPAEKAEQQKLRRAYVESVKANIRTQLNGVAKQKEHAQHGHQEGHSCNCGHCHGEQH